MFRTMRAIALFEGAKGAIVLAAGLGLLSLVNRDLQHVAAQVIHHLHMNPASHYPKIFLDAAANTSDTRLVLIAVGAAVYSVVRLVEAYGLWFARRWAEWFAAAAGAIYVPFEIYEMVEKGGWKPVLAFAINVAVVAFMVYALLKKRSGVRYEVKSRT